MVKRPEATIQTQRKRWEASNQTAAAIIVADPDRYGGEDSAQVRWARLVMRKALPITKETQKGVAG